MDEIWIYLIEAIIVAIISIAGTIFVKNGWESKILGTWETMKITFENWKPIVALYNEDLATQVSTIMSTLDEAFADGGLTLKEFEKIRKSFLPLWNTFMDFVNQLQSRDKVAE